MRAAWATWGVHTAHLLLHYKSESLTRKHIEIENRKTERDRESTEQAWETLVHVRQKKGREEELKEDRNLNWSLTALKN